MSSGNFGTCRGCGRQVMWVKTTAGKSMPVNPSFVNYRLDDGGKEKIVTPSGKVVTGTTGVLPDEADGMGYISHFATCPQARAFRRK